MDKQTNITVTGIDMGSANIKIAAVVRGGVQVIVNQANMRETPNVIGLGSNQRQIGELGKLKIKSNHANTVVSPARFLGFHHPCPYILSQLNFTPAKLQKSVEEVKFSLEFDKKKQQFIPQQLASGLITEIQTTISQTNQFQNKNMVIAIPGYLTQQQRRAIMDTIQIARKGVKNQYPIQLVSEEVATSMDYGYSRRAQFSQDITSAKNVLFIDLGHSKCNIFLTAFNKQHFRIINAAFDRQLGCKFMDWQILKFYASQFDSKNTHLAIKFMQSKKAVQKLLERIQKQRKILSGVNEADLNVECLLEGEDFYYTLTRQKFQQLCCSIILRFTQLLSRFVDQLKQKGIKIDSVELVGGGTRIPSILNAIKSCLGEEPSRTLNSSQCIAKGAALISAINSTIFRAQPFLFFENYRYNINLWVNGIKFEKKLFERNQTLVEKDKTFEINLLQDTQKLILAAQYDQGQIEQGLENKIFEAEISIKQKKRKRSKPKENQKMKQEEKEQQSFNKVTLHLTIDPSSYLIYFSKVTSQSLSLQTLKVTDFRYLNPQQLNSMQERQKEMTIRDLKIKRFYHKKNEFESKCYKLRDEIDNLVGQLKEYVQENKVKELRQMIEKDIEYLQNMDLDHIDSNHQLDKRQNTLQQKVKQFVDSTKNLKDQYNLLVNELKQLSSLIENLISTRQQYPEQVNQTGQWINSIFQKLQKSPKYLPPPVTSEQVKQMKNKLQNQVKIFDQQMQRRRTMSAREGIRTRQQNQHINPTGTFFRPQTGYNPFQGRPSNNYYSQYDNPNRSRKSSGGFWDGGFF